MLRRHLAFGIALAAGMIAGMALPLPLEVRVLVGLNVFYSGYLAGMLRRTTHFTADDLRRHAADGDAGLGLTLIIAMMSAAGGIGAVVTVLQGVVTPALAAIALLAVPLGWATVHMVMALHYAHAYYSTMARPLAFPGEEAPLMRDFVYFSLGIGMTAQVSDVIVLSSRLRQWVSAHAVGAFFFNTVLLALAVNAGVALAG